MEIKAIEKPVITRSFTVTFTEDEFKHFKSCADYLWHRATEHETCQEQMIFIAALRERLREVL